MYVRVDCDGITETLPKIQVQGKKNQNHNTVNIRNELKLKINGTVYSVNDYCSTNQIKYHNILAEACKEYAGPTSASLRRGSKTPYEEMSLQR